MVYYAPRKLKKVLKTSPTNTSLNENSFYVQCTPEIHVIGHNFFLMKCEVVDNRSCFPILKKYVIIVCRAIINKHVPCWFYSIPVLISAVGIVFEQIVCTAVLLGKTT